MTAAEVKTILTRIAAAGRRSIAEVETDLAQTMLLLSQAAGALNESFGGMHGEIARLRELALEGGTGPGPDALRARIEAVRERFDACSREAVTGLQFEDLTSQLIGRCMKRLIDLRELLTHVSAGAAGIDEGGDVTQAMQALATIECAGALARIESGGAAHKSVGQHHMESGEVELF